MATVLMKGIDVSKYQNNVDFKKVKAAGYDFVIIKASYGKYSGQTDSMFENHYKAAKSAGLYVGAYHYSYATTVDDAKKEAEVFKSALAGKVFEMPVYYDVEERKTLNMGRQTVSAICKTFCESLEKAGWFCGIYGGQELAQNYLTDDVKSKYAFWLAQYLKTPRYTGQYGMWQFGVAGAKAGNNPTGAKAVPGVPGECDMDYCYVDYPAWIKSKGMNGLKPDVTPTPNPTPQGNPYPVPSTTVQKGDEGDSVKWLQYELTESGYYAYDIDGKFGKLTLSGLLGFQFENGLEVDGKCGPKTRAALIAK